MENQDDEDTDPTLIRRATDITSESIEIEPGERAEIVLCPDRAMRSPILLMSSSYRNSRIIVEEVTHGRVPIFREDREVENFRRGRLTDLTVTANEPITIIVANTSNKRTTLGASLMESGTPTPEILPIGGPRTGSVSTTYRLKNLQSKDLLPRNIRPENLLQHDDPLPADKHTKVTDPKE
jgi:hypothetical protein